MEIVPADRGPVDVSVRRESPSLTRGTPAGIQGFSKRRTRPPTHVVDMLTSLSLDVRPTVMVRRVVVRPTPRRRHAVVRVIGDEIQPPSPRHTIVRIIGEWPDEPTVA